MRKTYLIVKFGILTCLSAGFFLAIAGCGVRTPQGTYKLRYQLKAGEVVEPEVMADAILARLNRADIDQCSVRALDDAQFEIEISDANKQIQERAKEWMNSTGAFEIRILAHRRLHPNEVERALDPSANPLSGDEVLWREFDPEVVAPDPSMVTRSSTNQKREALVLNDDWDLNGTYMESAVPGRDSSLRPSILGEWNDEGALLMSQLTTAHPPDSGFRVAIIFDGIIVSAPAVRDRVSRHFEITGNFTDEEVGEMVSMLRRGCLPARLDPSPVFEQFTADP